MLNWIKVTLSSTTELMCAFASLLQVLSPGRCLLLSVPGSQPALHAGQVLPPCVPLRVQESAGTACAGGELGTAHQPPVLLLTRDGAAPGALSHEPALAHLQAPSFCVSSLMIYCFMSSCQKAVGMFKVRGCSVLALKEVIECFLSWSGLVGKTETPFGLFQTVINGQG